MSQESFHPLIEGTFVTVILPIAAPKSYTYFVPPGFIPEIQVGKRVEVSFGKNKLYAALIADIHTNAPEEYKAKAILSVLDDHPIVKEQQIKLWKWMASYYACTLGEVMNAALPAGFKLASETRIIISPVFDDNYEGLNDKEYMIAEALSIQKELSIDEIRKILDQKTVYPLIQRLLDKKLIYLKEELKEKFKPKVVNCVRLQEPYASDSNQLEEAFDLMSRSARQAEAMMAYLHLARKNEFVTSQQVYEMAKVDGSVLKAMQKKGIIEIYAKEVSRLGGYEEELSERSQLSEQQSNALAEIKEKFVEKDVVLLHGVTGSGKTRIYMELIKEAIERNEQVLYLLPEIALTTQITSRLQKIFGDEVAVYHSRMSNNERVEMWKNVLGGSALILGARSSLFLPFQNLKMIIVDEEHDTSYKQIDPAPRYNARDTAIYLGYQTGAKVLLGTATPSIESYHNCKIQKYGLVEMPERFGGIEMPKMVIIDAGKEFKQKKMLSHFTSQLIEELKGALEREEQAILFKNRRGYSPTMRCTECNWHSECKNCDVSLTYHKFTQNLRCHYCGYQRPVPKNCPACGSHQVLMHGYGTEKIEDELKIFLPEAKIRRMDFDTVKGKHGHARIINDFEERRIDILVGTQMVTKGLDFDNVGVVGVLSADHLLQFPDFRSSERAFQMITQVSGRAGRKKKQGKVLIQAFDIGHPILGEVIQNDFQQFFTRELKERHEFQYPPFSRLIAITIKHRKPDLCNEAAKIFTQFLRKELGDRVKGPALPGVARVRNFYLLDVLIKLERDGSLIAKTKRLVKAATHHVQSQSGFSGVRININVDPY